MVLVAFKYKNIKYTLNNLLYLYMCSVILGGFLYMLDIEFSYKREGMIFYFDKFSILKECKENKDSYNSSDYIRFIYL